MSTLGVMAGGGDVYVDIEPARAVDVFMESLEGADGPTYYSYPTFIRYLTVEGAAFSYGEPLGGSIADTMAAVAKKLLALAGGAAYLADDRAYARGDLHREFPELVLFRIRLDEAFAESPVCPGIWVETRRFADLRVLSRMRRELRKTGVANGFKAVNIVKALLGLESVQQHH